MSLLINESYVNSTKPLWASASGGTISGNLVVNGNVIANEFSAVDDVVIQDASGGRAMRLTAAGPPSGGLSYIQTAGTIKFGQLDQGNTNSQLVVSAFGANADVLTIGGQIVGGGVTPLSSTVGAATVANGSPVALTITPPITISNAGIYDIQVSGYWATGATTTPSNADVASVTLTTGTGTSPTLLKYQYTDNQYPAFADAAWSSNSFHPFHIRARMPCNNTQALALTGSFTATGTYTGNSLGLAVTDLTVVRVA